MTSHQSSTGRNVRNERLTRHNALKIAGAAPIALSFPLKAAAQDATPASACTPRLPQQ